jgi:ElaB/YqjD/DUF883 family membrane-anchored ribosome-binding protein
VPTVSVVSFRRQDERFFHDANQPHRHGRFLQWRWTHRETVVADTRPIWSSAVRKTADDRSIEMNETTQKLAKDMKSVAADTRELVTAGAECMADSVVSAREKTRMALADIQAKISDAKQVAVDEVRAKARAADDYVHDSPWVSLGMAAVVGIAVGFLLGRR